ncbi:MAG: sigma-70 family RNA polymerase sigma factor [Bacteroidales bacterium]|nr:sigma-70 family RNA polymerase sigma factor [Bacteroidales bacterium]
MNDDALTSVFVGLRQRLRRMATAILGDSNAADDALQDAFCRLWTRRDRIAPDANAEALSTATVHNVCIDALRRRSHSPTVGFTDNLITEPPDDDGDDDATQREMLLQSVERIIAGRLTPQQQAIVQMRDVEGRSFEEIASALSMQPTAVRVALSRSRKLIREIYLNTHDDE